MKPKLLALLLFAGVSIAEAQPTPPPDAHTVNITLTDLSPADSPLKFYGTPFTCFEWEQNGYRQKKAEGEYHMSNVSGRAIVALYARADISCDGGGEEGIIMYDLFFKPIAIPAKEVIDMPVDLNEGDKAMKDGKPVPIDFTQAGKAGIVAKALWVQFDDGSQWGDKTVATEVLKDRQEAMQFYQRLLNESTDQAKLLATLEEKAPPRSVQARILRSLNEYRSEYGLPAVILMIKDKARIGAERMATGKF
jgi:hypothetical protein